MLILMFICRGWNTKCKVELHQRIASTEVQQSLWSHEHKIGSAIYKGQEHFSGEAHTTTRAQSYGPNVEYQIPLSFWLERYHRGKKEVWIQNDFKLPALPLVTLLFKAEGVRKAPTMVLHMDILGRKSYYVA